MMLDMDHVPWMSRSEIETEAKGVIAEACKKIGTDIRPPIPIEAVIENVFDLHLLVDNLTERYPHLAPGDDLLGATLVTERQILVHEKLLADSRSAGRYFFTCAHELGHWVLHRELQERAHGSGGASKSDPRILCRLSHGRKRGEWRCQTRPE